MRWLDSSGRGRRLHTLGSAAIALVTGLAWSAPPSLVAAETDDFKGVCRSEQPAVLECGPRRI
jgi:hypothetical protein